MKSAASSHGTSPGGRPLAQSARNAASSGHQISSTASNPNAGGIEAYYFRDPDGHALELVHFPPGKGDPRWQQPNDNLFLGIDHTAIGIENTAASLQFYRDLLGLKEIPKPRTFDFVALWFEFGGQQLHQQQLRPGPDPGRSRPPRRSNGRHPGLLVPDGGQYLLAMREP